MGSKVGAVFPDFLKIVVSRVSAKRPFAGIGYGCISVIRNFLHALPRKGILQYVMSRSIVLIRLLTVLLYQAKINIISNTNTTDEDRKLSDTYDFYKDRYNDIQRYAYEFLNQVPLTAQEQTEIVRMFCLGRNFETINSVQDYNKDWLIKGYEKVDIRDVKEPVGSIKGKFLDGNTFLREVMVQLPKALFEMEQLQLKQWIVGRCMGVARQRIDEYVATLRMQKIQIEAQIEKYLKLLSDYPCIAEE